MINNDLQECFEIYMVFGGHNILMVKSTQTSTPTLELYKYRVYVNKYIDQL